MTLHINAEVTTVEQKESKVKHSKHTGQLWNNKWKIQVNYILLGSLHKLLLLHYKMNSKYIYPTIQ